MTADLWLGAFCASLTALNLASIAVAGLRLRCRRGPVPSSPQDPCISIIRPIRGLERFSGETLGSTFRLDYPKYEVVFCVARASDPVVSLVERLIESYPNVPARLLVGEDKVSDNPKLNNCIKGWNAARHEWIILADSNVLMPRDYVQRLLKAWRPDSGLVCSTPIGSRPQGFWAEVECAFLNTLQARWQYAGEAVGLGFAQGKSMLWNRTFLDARGGIRALGEEIAEDAAATKIVRRAGLHVHLPDEPFEQPLGHRTRREVWARQIRWARLRRVTFPLFFLPEILSGVAVPTGAGAYAAFVHSWSVPGVVAALLSVWYGAEAALAHRQGWHLTWRTPLACLVRDLLIPCLWLSAWLADNVVWHGHSMKIVSKVSVPADAGNPAA